MELNEKGREEFAAIEDNNQDNIHSDIAKVIGDDNYIFSNEFFSGNAIATFDSIVLSTDIDNIVEINHKSSVQMPSSGPTLNNNVTDHVDAVASDSNMSNLNVSKINIQNGNMSKINMSTRIVPKINVPKFNISRPIVNLIINGLRRSVFLDSGATLSLIQQNYVDKSNIRPLSNDIKVYDVNGRPLKYIGITLVALSPPSDSRIVHLVPCLVVNKEVNFNADMLLSCKDISNFNGNLDLQNNELKGLTPKSPYREWRVPLIIDNDTVTRGLHVDATSDVPCDDTRAIGISSSTTLLGSTEMTSHGSSQRVNNVSSLKDFLAHERSGASKSYVSQSKNNGRRIIENNMKITAIRKLKAEALEEAKLNKQKNSSKSKVNNRKKNKNNFVMYSEVGSSGCSSARFLTAPTGRHMLRTSDLTISIC